MGDPQRLRYSAAAGATDRALIESARVADPTNEQCDALWLALSHRVPLGGADCSGGSGGTSPGASGAGLSGAASKIGGLGSLVHGVALLVGAGATAALVALAPPGASPPVREVAVVATRESAGPPSVAVASPVPAASVVLAAESQDDRVSACPVRTRPRGPVAASRAGDPMPPTAYSPLRVESGLLLRAREAIRSDDCAGAVERLKEAGARYPASALMQEREVLLIEALECAGETREAAHRAAAFLRAYPTSPHADAARRFAGTSNGE